MNDTTLISSANRLKENLNLPLLMMKKTFRRRRSEKGNVGEHLQNQFIKKL